MALPVEIRLDICTPEGKTWLAKVTGSDQQFGLARRFLSRTDTSTSRSGRTGWIEYLITEPGVYQRNEGRRSLRHNNGFFRVTADGEIIDLASAGEALAALREQP